MKVVYSSNNSGGSWWLDYEDWKKLENAGWTLKPLYRPGKDGRWLGAIATEAWIEAISVEEAVNNWRITLGMDPDDPGCECCGEPHYFREAYKDEQF